MPNIKTFDAGEPQLRPSETGSAAEIRLGTVTREYANQTARLMKETGEEWTRAFREVGGGLESIADHAQATADTQALLEASKDSSNLDLHFQDQIDGLGKPSLDPTTGEMKQPDLATTTAAGADLHDTYQQAQDAIRQKMVANGASAKALRQFDERSVERQAQFAHRLNAQVHTMAGIEATNNYEQSTNSAAALAAKSPGDLDNILLGWRQDTNDIMTHGVMSKEAAQAMGPKAIEAQRHIITSAIDAKARSGPEGLIQAAQDIQNPKYAPFIGRDINALTNHLVQVARQQREEDRAEQLEKDRAEKAAANARVGGYNQDRKPGDPLYDFKQDPYARKNPEWAHTAEQVSLADRDYDLKRNQPDAAAAEKVRGDLFDQLIVSGKASQDPEQAQHAVDVSYGKHEITKQEHAELTAQINNAARPENSRLNKERTAFFGPEGFGPSLTGPTVNGIPSKPEAGISTHAAKAYAADREEQIRSGQDPNSKDPKDLYREGTKVFLGNDPAFTKYFRSFQDNIQSGTNALTGKPSTAMPKPQTSLPKNLESNFPDAMDYIRRLPPGTVVQTPWGLAKSPEKKPDENKGLIQSITGR